MFEAFPGQPETKKCPYCAEEIQDEAIICHYCKKELPALPPSVPAYVPKSEANKKKKSKTATFPFILSLLSLITWIYPLFGFPVAITALVLALKKSKTHTLTTAAIIISSLGLLATVANSAVGAFQGARGELFTYSAPTRTPRPRATSTPPRPSNLDQTQEAERKNYFSGCRPWQTVKPEHEGQTLCVFGDIYEVYRTNDSATRVRFSNENNTFFMHSTNFYYTDTITGKLMGAGDCISNTAKIELYGGVPSMKIKDPKKCN